MEKNWGDTPSATLKCSKCSSRVLCIGSSGHLKVVCEWIFPIKTFQIFFFRPCNIGSDK